jgi:glutathione S-transferase
MCAEALGVDLELKPVNLLTGEHLTPEFIKMNPQHTIPTMDDNGFILIESRAMLQYLVGTYGKDDSLYPKDLKKRAQVDQRLYFDLGSLYKGIQDAYYPIFLQKKKPETANLEKFDTILGFLEAFLSQTKYVAGDNVTIADFAVIATLASTEAVGHSLTKFPKVTEYFERCKKEFKNYKETNQDGADDFGNFVKQSLAAI